MIAIGIGGRPEGGLKDSSANIRDGGDFVVNLVDEATAHAMVVTAIDFPHGGGRDRRGRADHPRRPASSSRHALPRAPAALECVHHQTIALPNDRHLVLGRIVAIHVRDDAVLDAGRCYIDTPKLNLVGRMHGGGWYTRTADQFEIPRIPLKQWKAAAE